MRKKSVGNELGEEDVKDSNRPEQHESDRSEIFTYLYIYSSDQKKAGGMGTKM